MPRVGSFALAFFGRIRKAQAPPFAAAGRRSFVLKRIFDGVLVISHGIADRRDNDVIRSA
jgi:hypothetical protein